MDTSIILDTNIIIYASDEPTKRQFLNNITTLQEKDFDLGISQFTRFEILKKASPPQKQKEMIELLDKFKSFTVTDEVLIISGILNTFYKSENIQREIDDGDLIIATTAILNQSLILTTNRIDFPTVFFEEVTVNPILYQKIPGLTRALAVYLLKPKSDLVEKLQKSFQ